MTHRDCAICLNRDSGSICLTGFHSRGYPKVQNGCWSSSQHTQAAGSRKKEGQKKHPKNPLIKSGFCE